MSNLFHPEEWKRQLGFLPVPLFANDSEDRYVMLNGGKGNFCLDIQSNRTSGNEAEMAWSTDVDHFITLRDTTIELARWDAPLARESYQISDVAGRLPLFQKYLESRQAPRERSVVAHAIGAFRTLRAKAGTNPNEHQALMAFLALFAKAWERQHDASMLGNTWVDSDIANSALADTLRENEIELALAQLLNPATQGSLRPNLDLLMRHASGRVFQEAHYLALVPMQSDLFLGARADPIGPASKSLGAFFTPTPLVRTVVEQALARLETSQLEVLHVFDPACGSGEFLRETLRQLSLRAFTGCVEVTGFDISTAACLMARFVLAAEAKAWNGRVKINVVCRDALSSDPWPSSVNVCLMNPPFVSLLEMSTEQRESVMQLLGPLRPKRADMAMAFVLRAIENLGARGIFGAVLPASMLDGESARPLREFLSPDIELNVLARLGSQQIFADVIVDPALVVATKCSADGRKFSPTTLVWADHEPRSSEMALRALRRTESPLPIGDITEDEHFSIYSANKATKTDDWAPRPYKAARLFAELASAPRVNKLFSVQQGTITGMNSALLLRDEDFRSLPKAEQAFFRPAIVNGSIRNGQLLSETWVFYPNSEYLPAIENEEMLEARLKTFYQGWLLPNRLALMRRARIKEECWWRLSEHRNWQVKPSVKIVSTYFGGAGSFALDRAGSFVVVQGYGWLPKTKAIQSDDRNALCLLAILNSPVTGDLLAGVSSNVAGGQWNLSKRFVERMPIIDPQLLAEDVRDTLASFGLAMCDGRPFEMHLLDRLVREVLSVHGRYS